MPKKVLIITRSFVREVNELLKYANHTGAPFEFSVVMPANASSVSPFTGQTSFRKLYWTQRMRAACYSPALFVDILRFKPDILHVFEEFSGLIAFQSILLNRLCGRKSRVLIYSAENIRQNMHALFRFTAKYVARHTDVAFVCSHGVKHVMEAEGYTVPIDVFPLGVDTQRFSKFSAHQLRKSLQLEGKCVLGYVGRLLKIKGIFLLVEAMQRLPESVHLLIIGSGPDETRLRKAVIDANLTERIHFFGKVVYTDLPQYLNCIDIGVVPSQTTPYWQEQFGRVLVEFMSTETPVIATDSGSIPEVLGQAGYLFHENNIQELIDKILYLIQHPSQGMILGQAGRQRAVTLYSLSRMCEQIFSHYRHESSSSIFYENS